MGDRSSSVNTTNGKLKLIAAPFVDVGCELLTDDVLRFATHFSWCDDDICWIEEDKRKKMHQEKKQGDVERGSEDDNGSKIFFTSASSQINLPKAI